MSNIPFDIQKSYPQISCNIRLIQTVCPCKIALLICRVGIPDKACNIYIFPIYKSFEISQSVSISCSDIQKISFHVHFYLSLSLISFLHISAYV